MAASKETLGRWFDEGVIKKATHLIVVCDTFDHDDYPVYANGDDETLEKYEKYSNKNMQTVMEVYDLRAEKTEQMEEHRAMRLPS